MNRQEAKAILEMHRPGGRDANDPQFAEALEMLEQDAELAQWFTEKQAFDTKVSAALKSVSVPADLKASLLAQWKPAQAKAQKRRPAWLEMALAFLKSSVVPERRILASPLWRNWQVRLALAVSLAGLAIIAGVLIVRTPASFAHYRQEVVESSWEGVRHLDLVNSDLAQVRQWLTQQNAEGKFALPSPLALAYVQGCRVLDWRGRKVSYICFFDGPKHLHLFVTSRDGFLDGPMPDAPQFEKCERWQTVSWIQGNNTYVLSGMKYTTFVRKFRKGGQWLFAEQKVSADWPRWSG